MSRPRNHRAPRRSKRNDIRRQDEKDRARGPLLLLGDRQFGPYILGKLVSNSGVWMFSTVAVVEAYRITGSAFFVALVTTALFSPQVVLAPISGRWSDNGNPSMQAMVGRVLAGLGAASLGAWMLLVPQDHGYAPAIVATSTLVGAGFAVGGPALQSSVPQMLTSNELAAGVALNGLTATASRAIGPAAGGVLLLLTGVPTVVLVGALTQFVHAYILRLVPLPRRPRDSAVATGSLFEAGVYVVRDRGLLGMLLGMAAIGAAAEPAVSLLPAIASDVGRSDHAGWLAAAFGCGAVAIYLVFGLLERHVPRRAVSVVGLMCMSAGLAVVAIAHRPVGAAAGLAVMGTGMALASTSVTTNIQSRTPDRLGGRIMAFWLVTFVGVRPLAGAVDGLLADHVSLASALWWSAALPIVAISCVLMRSRSVPEGRGVKPMGPAQLEVETGAIQLGSGSTRHVQTASRTR